MKYVILTVILVLCLTVTACSGDKAAELFETARFEEVQNNREHARELYEEIVKKYPGSEYAKKAQERLSQMKKDKSRP